MGIFGGLIDDGEWFGRVRSHPHYGDLGSVMKSYAQIVEMSRQHDIISPSSGVMSDQITSIFKPILKDYKKMPRPKSVEANRIRKDLLVGIEAHVWSAGDAEKWSDKLYRSNKSDDGYMKSHLKWGTEGNTRLGRALQYIETH